MTALLVTPAVRRVPVRITPRRAIHTGAAAAWLTLAGLAVSARLAGNAAHHHVAAAGPPLRGWTLMWLAMVAAMMWPLTVDGVEAALRTTYRRWRPLVAITHVGVYSACWLGAGLVLLALQRALVAPDPWAASWLIVGLAVAWNPLRMSLLWRCRRRLVQAPGGRRAAADAARSAVAGWRRCALLCGPAMAAMVPMASNTSVVMVAGAGAVWWEQRHPRAWRDPIPMLLLAVALAAVLVGAR